VTANVKAKLAKSKTVNSEQNKSENGHKAVKSVRRAGADNVIQMNKLRF